MRLVISRVWQLAAGRSFLARGLCLLLATIVAAATYGQSVSEYQVKAAFLYNFVKFVEWPENSFTSSSTALTLCVLGQDELSAELERSVAGKSVLQRQISAIRLDSPVQARGCHVLFIGESQSHAIKRILREVQGVPVLTVGDIPGFLEQGGMIRFVFTDGRVGFEINNAAAQSEHVRISSKLLALARPK
jgi:hypothetical protein